MAKEVEAKIYAAPGINRDSAKSIDSREEPALQAVSGGAAATQGRAA
ncbi:MAG: hypothetical protein JOY56_11820 [Solirubrobacterales bacterium]|nr:hypothetical protein [Solirubrobacterales bacterium]